MRPVSPTAELLDSDYWEGRTHYGAAMNQLQKTSRSSFVVFLSALFCCAGSAADSNPGQGSTKVSSVIVHGTMNFDVSRPFASARPIIPSESSETGCCRLSPGSPDTEQESNDPAPASKPVITEAGAAV